MKMYSLDAGGLMSFANQVKDAIAKAVEPSTADIESLVIVVGEKGWFQRIKDRLCGKDVGENDLIVAVLRQP